MPCGYGHGYWSPDLELESKEEKRNYIRQINLARRHINQKQKAKLIKQQLKDTPKKSNNQIAKMLGVDNETVKKYRDELIRRSEIRNVEKLEDTQGRKQPAEKENQEPKSKKGDKESKERTESKENEEKITNIPIRSSESTEKALEIAQETKEGDETAI